MNLYEKINTIMESVESLQKDGKAEYGTTKYKYLSEAKTTAEIRKQLVKHKLAILPIGVEETIREKITHGKYTYKLVNVENPEEYIILESGGQGHDSADKGSGKASSYAYKYLMWRTFAIPSNDDPDQISSDEIVAEQKAAKEAEEVAKQPIDSIKADSIKEKAENLNSNVAKLCERYKIKSLDELTKGQFAECIEVMDMVANIEKLTNETKTNMTEFYKFYNVKSIDDMSYEQLGKAEKVLGKKKAMK